MLVKKPSIVVPALIVWAVALTALAAPVKLPVKTSNLASVITSMLTKSPVTAVVSAMLTAPLVRLVMRLLGNPIGFSSWLVLVDAGRPPLRLALLEDILVSFGNEFGFGLLLHEQGFIHLSVLF